MNGLIILLLTILTKIITSSYKSWHLIASTKGSNSSTATKSMQCSFIFIAKGYCLEIIFRVYYFNKMNRFFVMFTQICFFFFLLLLDLIICFFSFVSIRNTKWKYLLAGQSAVFITIFNFSQISFSDVLESHFFWFLSCLCLQFFFIDLWSLFYFSAISNNELQSLNNIFLKNPLLTV